MFSPKVLGASLLIYFVTWLMSMLQMEGECVCVCLCLSLLFWLMHCILLPPYLIYLIGSTNFFLHRDIIPLEELDPHLPSFSHLTFVTLFGITKIYRLLGFFPRPSKYECLCILYRISHIFYFSNVTHFIY